jgi:hypothetical protein
MFYVDFGQPGAGRPTILLIFHTKGVNRGNRGAAGRLCWKANAVLKLFLEVLRHCGSNGTVGERSRMHTALEPPFSVEMGWRRGIPARVRACTREPLICELWASYLKHSPPRLK